MSAWEGVFAFWRRTCVQSDRDIAGIAGVRGNGDEVVHLPKMNSDGERKERDIITPVRQLRGST